MKGIVEMYRGTEAGELSDYFKREGAAEHPAAIQPFILAMHKHHRGVWEALV
ncbi:MAG: hypothetical protein LBF74_04845 [Treponema sp.]|jgi:hypothetical protein|nr:hypothetical protein [Treponema sp.]